VSNVACTDLLQGTLEGPLTKSNCFSLVNLYVSYDQGERGPFTRPWQLPVPPLTESVDIQMPYPCDVEDNGMVYVAWRGPSAVKELYR
jgi:hypothetical protein